MTRLQTAQYYLLHVFTASGAAWALLALLAATNKEWAQMFLWLGVAQIVDAVDGPIARRIKIAEKLPRWSGETLDLVVDYATYVFVPAYAIMVSGLLPNLLSETAGAAIVVTSALYFADKDMKMEDNHFRGFPAIWNVAAFYLLLLSPPPALAAFIIGGFMVLTFLPVPFIHPLRVVHRRRFNIALLLIWSALAITAIARGMAAGPWVSGALCVIGLYILGGGFLRRLPEPPEAVSEAA